MNQKKLCKRMFVLTLTVLLALGLSACRDLSGGITADDAKQCVQVEMDTTYKGDFAGCVDFYSNVTTSDAREQYDANVEGEALLFLDGMGVPTLENQSESVPASDLQVHRAKELYEKIYAKSDYSIVSSSKQDDGTFAVKVTIKPLDVFDLLNEDYDAGFEAFWAKFDAVDTDSMTDEEFATWYTETFAKEYYDTLLNLLEEQIPDIGYKTSKDIVIQVQQSEDGSLFISNEDLQNLDRLIIDYTLS